MYCELFRLFDVLVVIDRASGTASYSFASCLACTVGRRALERHCRLLRVHKMTNWVSRRRAPPRAAAAAAAVARCPHRHRRPRCRCHCCSSRARTCRYRPKRPLVTARMPHRCPTTATTKMKKEPPFRWRCRKFAVAASVMVAIEVRRLTRISRSAVVLASD